MIEQPDDTNLMIDSPFAAHDAERGGTIFDEGLAAKRLDALRPYPSADSEPYIIGPGSMPQQPDPNPWLK
jgi:hypothetical protein